MGTTSTDRPAYSSMTRAIRSPQTLDHVAGWEAWGDARVAASALAPLPEGWTSTGGWSLPAKNENGVQQITRVSQGPTRSFGTGVAGAVVGLAVTEWVTVSKDIVTRAWHVHVGALDAPAEAMITTPSASREVGVALIGLAAEADRLMALDRARID